MRSSQSQVEAPYLWSFVLCLELLRSRATLLSRLLWKQDSVDVGEDTTLGDGDARQEFAELLVVADSQLNVAGDDTGLLVVAGSVSCQLKDLSGQVLQHSGQVHWGTGTDSLCRGEEEEVVSDPAGVVEKVGLSRMYMHLELAPMTWNTSYNGLLLTSIASLLQVTSNSANWELQTSLCRLADSLLAGSFAFTTSRHVD